MGSIRWFSVLSGILLLGGIYAASAPAPPQAEPQWEMQSEPPAVPFPHIPSQEEDGYETALLMTKVFWGDKTVEPKEIELRAFVWGNNLLSATLFRWVTILPPHRVLLKKEIISFKVNERPLLVHPEYELLNSFGQMYYKIGPPLGMEKKFPLGSYVYRVVYWDSEDGKVKKRDSTYDLSGGFPPRPVINYPQHDQTGVELEPLIQWERAPDNPNFKSYFIAMGRPRPGTPDWEEVLYVQIEDIAQTEYRVPPGVLEPNSTGHLWLGITHVGLESKSGIQFTTTD